MSNINQYENFTSSHSLTHTLAPHFTNAVHMCKICEYIHICMFIQMLNNLQAFYMIVLITLTNLLWEIMQSRKDNLAICNPFVGNEDEEENI